MKKSVFIGIAIALTVVLCVGVSFALEGDDGRKLYGKHYQFNIIGMPNGNGIGGDSSNGNTIMVPLDTVKLTIPGVTPPDCPDNYPDSTVIDDTTPVGKTKDQLIKFTDQELADKTKIYFNDDSECPSVPTGFEIVDRDATDGEAHVCLETGANGAMIYDVYIRILGKPNKCMDINGLVYYDGSGHPDAGWYWSGTVLLKRKGGKSTFINANDLFDIWWCDTWSADTTPECTSASEYSVFSTLFDGYMWQINNHGARIVQVRLYPVLVD